MAAVSTYLAAQRPDAELAERLNAVQKALGGTGTDLDVTRARVRRFLEQKYAAGELKLLDTEYLQELESASARWQKAQNKEPLDEFFRLEAARAVGTHGNEGVNADTVDLFLSRKLNPPFDKTMGDYMGIELAADEHDDTWLKNQGLEFRVRRSFFESNKTGLPAQIAWTQFGEEDETAPEGERRTFVEIEGAAWLQFNKPLAQGLLGSSEFSIYPVLVIEADTSTRASDNRDRVAHRAGFETDIIPRDQATEVWHHFRATFDFTTDRDYDAEEYGGTLQWFPTFSPWSIGLHRPLVGEIRAAWQPYLTATLGNVEDSGGSQALADKDDYIDLAARVDASFKWRRLTLTPEATVFWETQNDLSEHVLLGVAAQWSLTDNDSLSLVASYRNGERSPLFQDEERVQIALGLKF